MPEVEFARLWRKKPVEVEAMLLAPNDYSVAAVSGWLMAHGFLGFRVHGDERPFGIAIETLEGTMVAAAGDYIIRGVQGEFYPCKPDIFRATYEPVDQGADQ